MEQIKARGTGSGPRIVSHVYVSFSCMQPPTYSSQSRRPVWDSLTATPALTYPWAMTKWVGENHMTNINYPFNMYSPPSQN